MAAVTGAEGRLAWLASPAIVLLLCGLGAAFFWKALLLHQALLPADILYSKDPLWGPPLAPQPLSPPVNPLDSDALTEFYPWTALAADALRHGTLPLWNPYAFAGTPFLGAMQTAVLYPVNVLLEYLLAPVDVLGVRAAIHLALTLVGTFLFARRLALSRSAALLAALSFGLGLPYVVWLEHPMGGAIAWLPWMLFFVDLALAVRQRLWPLLGLAAVVALEMLSGHGESAAHALLLCAAYALFLATLIARREGGVRAAVGSLAPAAVGFMLGIAVAGAQLLPALAQIPASEAAADRTTALAAGPCGLGAVFGDPAQWKTLVVALVPDFFGNPTWRLSALPLAAGGYNELALYVGSIPLLLAALALWRVRRGQTLFFGLVALVALGMAVRLPLFALLDELPVLRVAANGRLRVEYAFAVAMLAGYGLDVVASAPGARAAWRLIWPWLIGLGACAAGGIALLSAARPGGQALGPISAARVALPAAWVASFAVALWLYRRGLLGGAALRAVAPLLCAADLFAVGGGYHAMTPRDLATATPPAVRAIQGDRSLYRVVGLGPALWPSLSSLYGLQDVRGYDPAYGAAYERYFAASFPGAGGMRLALAAAGPSPSAARALDLMNVKYLFGACAVRLNARYYHLVYREGTGCVYRNRSAMPRASIVHMAAWATPARAAVLLGRGSVDPRQMALLDPATAARRDFPSPPTSLPGGKRGSVNPHPPPRADSGARLGSGPSRGPAWGPASPASGSSRSPRRRGRSPEDPPFKGRFFTKEGGAEGKALRDTPRVEGRAALLPTPPHKKPTPVREGTPGPRRSAGGGVRADVARVTSYDLDKVDVSVDSRAPGMLVLTDAYAPGWRASVDGRPAALARADAVFRAVPLPAGTHRVSFTYEPDAFALGSRISVAALALWGVLLTLALLGLRRPSARG